MNCHSANFAPGKYGNVPHPITESPDEACATARHKRHNSATLFHSNSMNTMCSDTFFASLIIHSVPVPDYTVHVFSFCFIVQYSTVHPPHPNHLTLVQGQALYNQNNINISQTNGRRNNNDRSRKTTLL